MSCKTLNRSGEPPFIVKSPGSFLTTEKKGGGNCKRSYYKVDEGSKPAGPCDTSIRFWLPPNSFKAALISPAADRVQGDNLRQFALFSEAEISWIPCETGERLHQAQGTFPLKGCLRGKGRVRADGDSGYA